MNTPKSIIEPISVPLSVLAQSKLPTQYGEFDLYAFPNAMGAEPHLALVYRSDSKDIPLVRVHSECLTGDVFSSTKCDCEAQLHFGLSQISQAQTGILIYLRQEGRGIGLVEKIKAYALQDQGLDTIQANLELGHLVDARNFAVAADILKALKINKIKLITNNPQKQQALSTEGIDVIDVMPTPRFETAQNKAYLDLKSLKMGHKL